MLVVDPSIFGHSGTPAVAVVSNVCVNTPSGKYQATSCQVQQNANTTRNSDSDKNCAVNPKYNSTYPHNLYSNAFLDEAEKVKANAFILEPDAKYGIYVNEIFGDGLHLIQGSTLSVDGKLFGAYAKAVEFNEIKIISQSKIQRNSRRSLLKTGDTSNNNVEKTATAGVPECPKIEGSTTNMKYNNGSTLLCGSHVCPTKDMHISATDNSGFAFKMQCKKPDTADDNTLFIWIIFTMSLIALFMVSIVCIYFGYHTLVLRRIRQSTNTMNSSIKLSNIL
jgi:hypothetical protein